MSKQKVDPIFNKAKQTIIDAGLVHLGRDAGVPIYSAGIIVAAIDRLTDAVKENTAAIRFGTPDRPL